MREYLFQPIRGMGTAEPVLLTAEDDAEAIRRALSSEFPDGCEVWDRYRLLGRFFGSHHGQGAEALCA